MKFSTTLSCMHLSLSLWPSNGDVHASWPYQMPPMRTSLGAFAPMSVSDGCSDSKIPTISPVMLSYCTHKENFQRPAQSICLSPCHTLTMVERQPFQLCRVVFTYFRCRSPNRYTVNPVRHPFLRPSCSTPMR